MREKRVETNSNHGHVGSEKAWIWIVLPGTGNRCAGHVNSTVLKESLGFRDDREQSKREESPLGLVCFTDKLFASITSPAGQQQNDGPCGIMGQILHCVYTQHKLFSTLTPKTNAKECALTSLSTKSCKTLLYLRA